MTFTERILAFLNERYPICRHCKQPIEISQGALEWLGVTEYFHPNQVDGATDGINRDGFFCDSGRNDYAEPMEGFR
jgi:hypothetical protein